MISQNIPSKESFDKIKVIVDFTPQISSEQVMQMTLKMNVKLLNGISWNLLKDNNQNVFFTPWYKSKDRFGGDIYINETSSFQGYQNPKVYKGEFLYKFFKDYSKPYPSWIGYFDKMSQLKREFRNSGKTQMIEDLKIQRIFDEKLFKEIQEFEFRK